MPITIISALKNISLKRIIILFVTFLFTLAFSILLMDFWVSTYGKEKIYYNIEDTPVRKIGLVLGTSKYIGKTLNQFYSYRIDAAKALYQNNKIDVLLLSGDNAHLSYNEPWTMKKDMLKAGVPEDRIYLDYAGFRTLDSVVRAREVFDANEFILITQAFHCERALFIAAKTNIDAICYAVPSPKGFDGYKIRMREVLARVKAVLDIYILKEKPKFLGPKESITLI